jgi:hypothetical protein
MVPHRAAGGAVFAARSPELTAGRARADAVAGVTPHDRRGRPPT